MLEKFISRHLSEPKGIGGRIVFYFMNRQNRPIYEKVTDVLALSDNEKFLIWDVEVVPFFKGLAYCYIYRKREG